MGMLGDLFPGRKLLDEGGEDADGEPIRQPWQIDLDSGVVRLRGVTKPAARPEPKTEPDSKAEPDSEAEPEADSKAEPEAE
jgi:hypothetical protein